MAAAGARRPDACLTGLSRDGTTAVRTLPAGLPEDTTVSTVEAVGPYAVAALRDAGAIDVLTRRTPTKCPNGEFRRY
jgi:hypothetical protein